MRKLGFLCVASSLVWQVACGVNSAKSPSSSFGSNSTVTSVMVSCSPSTIVSGTTAGNQVIPGTQSQCSATVNGTGNFSTDVIWSANKGATISASGQLSFSATPVITTPVMVTVKATSNQNLNVLGTATVIVNPLQIVTSIAVICSPPTITPGQTSQCSANVSGFGNFNPAVTWSANMGAQISSTGLLSFNQTITSPVAVTVTATSVQTPTVSGTATVTVSLMAFNNVAPIIVDSGPQNIGTVDVAFVTVTLCVPGTNNCQNIDHVLLDTGSEGLRLLSSASGGEFNLTLPQETIDSNPVDECTVFAGGYTWGPAVTADVTVAGESASSVPVQVVIPPSSSPAVPMSCSNQSTSGNLGASLDTLGANGIIGVGLFQNDCGEYCVQYGAGCNGTNSAPCVYYQCPASGCNGTNIPIAQQVPNPVTLFADNNGVLIQLPAVPDGGSLNVAGSLIFGIGTQSNNGLGSATVYPVPDNGSFAANIITTFKGQSYPNSFIDSGSNGIFFLTVPPPEYPRAPDKTRAGTAPQLRQTICRRRIKARMQTAIQLVLPVRLTSLLRTRIRYSTPATPLSAPWAHRILALSIGVWPSSSERTCLPPLTARARPEVPDLTSRIEPTEGE